MQVWPTPPSRCMPLLNAPFPSLPLTLTASSSRSLGRGGRGGRSPPQASRCARWPRLIALPQRGQVSSTIISPSSRSNRSSAAVCRGLPGCGEPAGLCRLPHQTFLKPFWVPSCTVPASPTVSATRAHVPHPPTHPPTCLRLGLGMLRRLAQPAAAPRRLLPSRCCRPAARLPLLLLDLLLLLLWLDGCTGTRLRHGT